jgi:hypothetical protein
MADQPGVMGPESFPIRDPRDASMSQGRMLNPPRYMARGGFTGPSKWFGNQDQPGEKSDKNVIQLEGGGPTGVKAAKRTSQNQMGV